MFPDLREAFRNRERRVSRFYAATIDGPDTVHEQLPSQFFNGRGRHQVRTSPITLTLSQDSGRSPSTVVGDDNGKPLAGDGVFSVQWNRGHGL